MTLAKASVWASEFTGSEITPANIQYLVKYDRIHSFREGGTAFVSVADLEAYFKSRNRKREESYKAKLGDDVNWRLSFDQFKESETTKHVHRLHPYKGKYIPQLVEYFLDDHADEFKTRSYFSRGDIVFDPFCGSGTTLVQANELGIHGIGVDVSAFNCLISNLKLATINIFELSVASKKVALAIEQTESGVKARNFERVLLSELGKFNALYFPAPDYRAKVRRGEIDETQYGAEKEKLFLSRYRELIDEFEVVAEPKSSAERFLDNWFNQPILDEFSNALNVIDQCQDSAIRDYLRLILSRTARSCRATTHYDLATLIEPQSKTYYCQKHSKICKPLFSCLKWWNTYSNDTIKRLREFAALRTDTMQTCLTGDSRKINIPEYLRTQHTDLYQVYGRSGIRGIFSSPPYVGLINYHEQHAYAYEMFGFERNDELEIGAMFNGQSKQAQADYVKGIAEVLTHARKFMIDDFDIFLVANDKFKLYPEIAHLANLKIEQEYKRPVLNRAEGNIGAYSESIFHMIKS